MSCSEDVVVRICKTVRDGEYEIHAATSDTVMGEIGFVIRAIGRVEIGEIKRIQTN